MCSFNNLSDLLDYYASNLDEIKSKKQEYYYSYLIDKFQEEQPLTPNTEIRLKNIAYIKKYSPTIYHNFTAETPKIQSVFRYNNNIFIRENWMYYIISDIQAVSMADYTATSISECIGIQRLLAFCVNILKIKHCILKRDMYAAVRPSDLDAVINFIDLTDHKSYHILRFLNYNKLYSSLYNIIKPVTNKSMPNMITGFNKTKPSETFVKVINSVCEEVSKNVSLAEDIKHCEEYYGADFYNTLQTKIENKTLKVLLLTSRYTTALQYFIRDVANGFNKLGYETHTFLEADDEATGVRPDVMSNIITQFKPDLVFQIDYSRYHSKAIPSNIPFMFWIQDPMMGHLAASSFSELFTKNDITLSIVHPKAYPNLKYPNIIYFPVHVDTDLFSGDPDNTEYDYDMSMVNHLALPSELIKINNEDYQERLLKLLTPIYKKDPHSLLTTEDFCKVLKPVFGNLDPKDANHVTLIDHIMLTVGNSLCRTSFVDWILKLKEYSLALYGNNWNTFPRFAPFSKGPAVNGVGTACIYNRSKINFSTSVCISGHPRVFEAIASGGFVMVKKLDSRDHAPLDILLKEGDGYVFVKNEEDLKKKVRHYLTHEDERREIIKRGHAIVRNEWSATACAKKLLSILIENYR